jgi:5-methylcytosine-specific restriction endonuclease McrA
MFSRQVFKRIISPEAQQFIEERRCPICGKPKADWNRRTDWMCCSTDCTKRFYNDYYSVSWETYRIKIFERDNFTCKICSKQFITGFKSNLIADHITPISIGGDNWDMNNLQTLCIDCNKIKTAQDMKVIAKYRAKEKILEKNRVLI